MKLFMFKAKKNEKQPFKKQIKTCLKISSSESDQYLSICSLYNVVTTHYPRYFRQRTHQKFVEASFTGDISKVITMKAKPRENNDRVGARSLIRGRYMGSEMNEF